MAPRQQQKNEITIDVSQPVGNDKGGARTMGRTLVCDFGPDDQATGGDTLVWKPYMDIGVEIGVLTRDDGTVLVFARRRLMADEIS